MFLSRETQSGNQKTKSQMFVTMGDGGNKSTEKIWEENGFFNDQKIDLTIPKVNFPENTLCYVNQGTVSQIKDGNAIYLEYVILSQIMAMANIDPNIDLDTYEFKENECLLFVPCYNKENGLFQGLKRTIGFITLRGDKDEVFFSYGYDEDKSNILYCHMKQQMPNIFQCTAFKKHHQLLLNEKATDKLASSLFLFLPSTVDRKESTMKYLKSVYLQPIDSFYDDLKGLNNGKDFDPADLESEKRDEITPLFYKYMKKVAETSNSNLIKNARAFLSKGGEIDTLNTFHWVDDSMEKSKKKFQMSY